MEVSEDKYIYEGFKNLVLFPLKCMVGDSHATSRVDLLKTGEKKVTG